MKKSYNKGAIVDRKSLKLVTTSRSIYQNKADKVELQALASSSVKGVFQNLPIFKRFFYWNYWYLS